MAVPPIQLTREEYASLKKIAERPCPLADIPQDHIAKFINYGLAQRDVMILRSTKLGQLELLRQRFRGLELPSRIVLDATTTRGSALFSGDG